MALGEEGVKQIYPLLYSGDPQGDFKDFQNQHTILEALENGLCSFSSVWGFFFFQKDLAYILGTIYSA